MADITKCSNNNCVALETCYRHRAESSEYWQSWALFTPEINSAGEDFECATWIEYVPSGAPPIAVATSAAEKS